MATVGEEERESESIWSSVLEDVISSRSKTGKTSPKRVLVLGDVCSGKSTLIDRLCSVSKRSKRSYTSQHKKYLLSGCSLEYRSIDVHDDMTDDYLARLGVWNLDGVVWHSQLLPFVLNEGNINDTIVMIVIDLGKPWGVIESLERWTGVINKHINGLKLTDRQRRQMEEKMVQSFQGYIDPELADGSSVKEDDNISLPLEDNTLSCNLGVPLIVACTKSDCFVQLEKNEKYQDEHFDFIQQHIRRFCLNYGAALFYLSSKDNKNIEILHKYLVHKAYGLSFKVPAYVVERDAVFIPSGWDSDKRITVLSDQMKHFNPREPLTNIIVPPRTNTAPSSQQNENISSEDDQVLLLAQQAHISKSPRPQATPTSSTSTSSLSSGSGGGKERSPRLSSTALHDSLTESPSKVLPPSSSAPGTGGTTGGEVLATFFNNLLAKKGRVGGGGVEKKATPKTEK